MTLIAQSIASDNGYLSPDAIRQSLHEGLEKRFTGQRLLVLIPDHTRTVPLPQLFRLLVELLHDTRQLDFMVALGTHPPLSQSQLLRLLGLTADERAGRYAKVGLYNHAWDSAGALTQIATLTQDQIQEFAGDRWHFSLDGDVPVRINRRIFDYDHLLILGPSFPHEVVGISGGAKYLFPGISGPEMIHVSHWLSALVGVVDTIGLKETPVRRMIHAAAAHVSLPVTLLSLVVIDQDRLAGLFIGDHLSAWSAAADLSCQRHITWVDRPFERVLSVAPPMYDELWTAGKAMYKLEPILAADGHLIIHAPHLDTVSHVHGRFIYEIGYHVLPYFLEQWPRFKHIPLGVLAHSTHVRGAGTFRDGLECPRAAVSLSSQLSPADCRRLALGYVDPATIDLQQWQDREDEAILYVPKAGEMLYRLRPTG